MTSIAVVQTSAFAEGGRILDGRWLCSNIAGNVTEDTPAELKDDFGLYVNKPWILQTEFTMGIPTVSNHTEVQADVMNRLIGLMKDESITGHDAELVHKLYALTGDWDYRNAQGLSPALPYMQAIAGIDSLDALLKYLCSEDRLTCTVPFNAHIMSGDADPAVYAVFVEPVGLMLDDPEEYTKRTEFGQAEYDRYRQIAGYMLARLGCSESEIDSMLDNAIAFETLLAKCSTDRSLDVAEGDYTPEALSELVGSFPILDVLKSIDCYTDSSYHVVDPNYFTAFQAVFTEENVPLIRDWLTIDAAMYIISRLDKEAAMREMAINIASMGGSLLEASRMIEKYRRTLQASKIGTVADKNFWDQLEMTSFTVNGLYIPANNSITITAGILGGEYYNEDMNYEQMLGGIGMIIGHEITHAFDNKGAKYDKNGAAANWWTDEDYSR